MEKPSLEQYIYNELLTSLQKKSRWFYSCCIDLFPVHEELCLEEGRVLSDGSELQKVRLGLDQSSRLPPPTTLR